MSILENINCSLNEKNNKTTEINLNLEEDIDDILKYYIEYYKEVNILYPKIYI